MNVRRFRNVVAIGTAAVLVTGCGNLFGSDEPDAPPADETPEETPDETPDEAPDEVPEDDEPEAGDLETEGEAEPEAGDLEMGGGDGSLETDGGDGGDGDDGGEDAGSGGGRATPDDIDLDFTARHPGGTVLDVSTITFEGAEIRVAAELLNGASDSITISLSGGNRLRLIDDTGAVYNFVIPDDLRDRNIDLAQGESISGDFVFLGPISSNATSLTLAANTRQDNPLISDMEGARSGENQPTIVISGIDLDW